MLSPGERPARGMKHVRLKERGGCQDRPRVPGKRPDEESGVTLVAGVREMPIVDEGRGHHQRDERETGSALHGGTEMHECVSVGSHLCPWSSFLNLVPWALGLGTCDLI